MFDSSFLIVYCWSNAKLFGFVTHGQKKLTLEYYHSASSFIHHPIVFLTYHFFFFPFMLIPHLDVRVPESHHWDLSFLYFICLVFLVCFWFQYTYIPSFRKQVPLSTGKKESQYYYPPHVCTMWYTSYLESTYALVTDK